MKKAFTIAVVCALALVLPAAAQRFGGVSGQAFGGHAMGPAPSVTSPGFGQPFGRHFGSGFDGHAFGPAPSVNSPGFGQPFGPRFGRPHVLFPFRHDRFRHSFVPFFSLGVPVVYPFFDYGDLEYEQPSVVQPGQPQPIVIVVPGAETASAAQPEAPVPAEPEHSAQPAAAGASPPEKLEKPVPTTIVLRDGHRLQLTDYAVVGNTLYDLHDGRTKKIDLAEVDLPATVKANEENGVEFVVPGPLKKQ